MSWVGSRLVGYKKILALHSALCLLSVMIIGEVEFWTLFKIGWNDKIYLQGGILTLLSKFL